MPKAIPFPTKLKEEKPKETTITPADIDRMELEQEQRKKQGLPPVTEQIETKPDESALVDTIPEESALVEETPEVSPPKEEFPSDVIKENCIKLKGQLIEIKPTKVKYFRNKTASVYGWLKRIPLTEFLLYQKGQLEPDRDADQILYDFLVAALDSSELVRDNYDEMTADDVEQIVRIFGRINHIDEKEEAARKNREAQAQKH